MKKRVAEVPVTLPKLLTVKEVLDILRISRGQFDKLKNNGEIKIIKGEFMIRVEQAEVQRWIEAHRSES